LKIVRFQVFQDTVIHLEKDLSNSLNTSKSAIWLCFLKVSTLTANEDVTEVYLGRPLRIYAETVFINYKM